MFLDLMKKNRSYRRFDTSIKMTDAELRSCIEAARLASSAGNQQALRFALITDKADETFATLKFAAYLKDWGGPAEHERPCAYIAIMLDTELTSNRAIDIGIAAEAILLRATELGFGGCMFRSFKREELDSILAKAPYHTELVIALGKPAECVKLTEYAGDIKYYRDDNDSHCVPKLSLDELII